LSLVDASIRRLLDRGRAHVDRSRHAPACRIAAQVRILPVEGQWKRRRAVHVLVDHGYPLVLEVPRQLELNQRVIDGNGRRHDHQVGVVALPERMNDGRHQAENAASPLELVQGRPVVVQAVKELGMDRVRHFDPALVVGLPAVERKLLLLGPVKF
jgi:hypothetical protein